MNILFLSMMNISTLDEHSMYADLLKIFAEENHSVTVISPVEKRDKKQHSDYCGNRVKIYNVRVGNITNTPFVEKGISVVRIPWTLKRFIKKTITDEKIDLFIVSSPPVTFARTAEYIKKKYNAKVYLFLKDIWPASLFDLKVPGGKAAKKIVCCFFRRYEVALYNIADEIGCLSDKNVSYVLDNNADINRRKLHVNPNAITPREVISLSAAEKTAIRKRYGIPQNRITFIYGGTLGIGQGVPDVVECLKASCDLDCHFVVTGKGIHYHLLEEYLQTDRPPNLTLINGLPKSEYERLLSACDVGMLFLRYTAQTPNIPSRMLSYMEYGKPVLACVDPMSDVGEILKRNGCGWECRSNDANAFRMLIQRVLESDLQGMGMNSRKCLETEFTARRSYEIIMNRLGESVCNESSSD